MIANCLYFLHIFYSVKVLYCDTSALYFVHFSPHPCTFEMSSRLCYCITLTPLNSEKVPSAHSSHPSRLMCASLTRYPVHHIGPETNGHAV